MIIYSCIPILTLYAAWRIQRFWVLFVINFIIGVAVALVNRPVTRAGGPYDAIVLAEIVQILIAVLLVKKLSTEYNERVATEKTSDGSESGSPSSS